MHLISAWILQLICMHIKSVFLKVISVSWGLATYWRASVEAIYVDFFKESKKVLNLQSFELADFIILKIIFYCQVMLDRKLVEAGVNVQLQNGGE